MKIDVEITRLGPREGTSAWLITELENCRAEIAEAYTPIGNRHSLLLRYNMGGVRRQLYLAGFEPEDGNVTKGMYSTFRDSSTDCPYLTRNACNALYALADDWCAIRNASEEDFEIALAIARNGRQK